MKRQALAAGNGTIAAQLGGGPQAGTQAPGTGAGMAYPGG